MWESRRLTTLWASTACYRGGFTFYLGGEWSASRSTRFTPDAHCVGGRAGLRAGTNGSCQESAHGRSVESGTASHKAMNNQTKAEITSNCSSQFVHCSVTGELWGATHIWRSWYPPSQSGGVCHRAPPPEFSNSARWLNAVCSTKPKINVLC
jgi:hypothetical protein